MDLISRLTVRLSGTDYEPDGMTIEDTIYYAKELEKLGIDAFHISGGDHHTMIHQVSPMAMPVCYNVWAAEAVKERGARSCHGLRFHHASSVRGRYSGAGKGRFHHAGTSDVGGQRVGEEGDGRPSGRHPARVSAATKAVWQRSSFLGRTVMCAVNPVLGFEEDLAVKPAETKKKVVIAGGGPAGMEAARVLKLKGHDVTIYEMRKLGGYLHEASAPEFKEDIRHLIDYQIHQIEKLEIPVSQRRTDSGDGEGRGIRCGDICGWSGTCDSGGSGY